MRVLVVEDDRELGRQLADQLGREGYAVDRALDGEEGEFMGATEPYDAVVLDLGRRGWTASRSCAAGAPPATRCRSWSSPPATPGRRRCRASTPGRTTTWPSR